MTQESNNSVWNSVLVWRAIAGAAIALVLFLMFFEIKITPRFVQTAGRAGEPTSLAAAEVSAAAAATLSSPTDTSELTSAVLPAAGVTLPVTWGDLGRQLLASGVIDEEKFRALYAGRGGLDPEQEAWLTGRIDAPLLINQQNAQYLLNLLWAFGLANKNPILEEGPMQNPSYGGAGGFASTGGWSLALGEAMDHYSAHTLVTLTVEQQELVERVAKNIYRPCCGNAVLFPDCNHGMAMLGLLELLAAQGADEETMYRAALAVNSYWFPETYMTIAKYFAEQGIVWSAVDARLALSAEYSSAGGYRNIRSKTGPVTAQGGGGCGV